MKNFTFRSSQRGVALAVSLILLTILTLISIYAASTGGLELRMARNMQESLDSFQEAEAGIAALVSLVRSGPDPFDGADADTPFSGVSPNPLNQLNDGSSSVAVNVILLLKENDNCPRVEASSTVGVILCDYYRVESRHTSADARTKVDEGVVKQVIGNVSL